jgi:hypothetical protein
MFILDADIWYKIFVYIWRVYCRSVQYDFWVITNCIVRHNTIKK